MASCRKRGPYPWQAQVRKKGLPLQTKTVKTRAEVERRVGAIEVEMDTSAFISRTEHDEGRDVRVRAVAVTISTLRSDRYEPGTGHRPRVDKPWPATMA